MVFSSSPEGSPVVLDALAKCTQEGNTIAEVTISCSSLFHDICCSSYISQCRTKIQAIIDKKKAAALALQKKLDEQIENDYSSMIGKGIELSRSFVSSLKTL